MFDHAEPEALVVGEIDKGLTAAIIVNTVFHFPRDSFNTAGPAVKQLALITDDQFVLQHRF